MKFKILEVDFEEPFQGEEGFLRCWEERNIVTLSLNIFIEISNIKMEGHRVLSVEYQ